MGDALPIIAALLGGGTIATLVGLVLHYRAENTRTYAEGGKFTAEADATESDSILRRYDGMFEALETEIGRIRESHEACEASLADLRVKLGAASDQLGRLRIEAAGATADVQLARAEIVRLQDRLDRIDAAL